ncbi:MAG: aryl-sulfate sulfotransferase [Rhodobacteraceae bacterium]|nr:aryl-sulfate sulfotransferase [Paracoccaceae bacterium]MBO28595.1 aryl-sulfate sulfotransferase [Paracoccaceae bacterium]
MTGRPVKHSVTLRGHRTSISLEAAFWDELRKIAARRDLPINALVAEIDEAREMDTGLASAIRVHILSDLRAQVAERD